MRPQEQEGQGGRGQWSVSARHRGTPTVLGPALPEGGVYKHRGLCSSGRGFCLRVPEAGCWVGTRGPSGSRGEDTALSERMRRTPSPRPVGGLSLWGFGVNGADPHSMGYSGGGGVDLSWPAAPGLKKTPPAHRLTGVSHGLNTLLREQGARADPQETRRQGRGWRVLSQMATLRAGGGEGGLQALTVVITPLWLLGAEVPRTGAR